jgi:choline dehydrogenase-like flavoprotein
LKKAIIIGSGAGGGAAAAKLQGHFDVTVLEAGKKFKPLTINLRYPRIMKKAGLLHDERLIQTLFPHMQVQKTKDMVLVTGSGLGGSTTICTGNAMRCDAALKQIGINLYDEFREMEKEIPVTTAHRSLWNHDTNKLFDICESLDLYPEPVPKMGRYDQCRSCGQCVLGCRFGVRWDSREYLSQAKKRGAEIITGCKVRKIDFDAGGTAVGVTVKIKHRLRFFPADVIVLAAGGLGTPVILESSGIDFKSRLFVDPVLCVAAERQNSRQNTQIPMPFYVQQNGYMLSPYFDHLSFFFNRQWHYPPQNIISLMIKLADTPTGSVLKEKIDKNLSGWDKLKLQNAVEQSKDILMCLGINKKSMFLGTLNAGHPGGVLGLTEAEAETMHPPQLPENVYVCDASLIPESLGTPPILTITALSKKISQKIIDLFS